MATAIIVTTGITAFAAEKKLDNPVSQKTNDQSPFPRMEIENDIGIMLVENPGKSIEFTGADADIAKVDWKIKNGVLQIKSKKGSLKGKVKLVINVNQLKEIAIRGESELRSDGELHSASLRISLDGGCFVSVRSKGNINVVNEDGTELDVHKVAGNVKSG
jgi:Putative auto-transporter adhesin, head GIN domain